MDTGNSTVVIPPYTVNNFGFLPNKDLEIAALVLYSTFTCVMLGLIFWKKTYFMGMLIAGGLLEIVGFITRIYETSHLDNEPVFIVSEITVLIAPTVMAAAVYALTARLMSRGKVTIPIFTPLVTKWFFLTFDVIAFFVQGGGGGVLGSAKTADGLKMGANIILGGLSVSLGVFITFLVVSLVIHIKSIKSPQNQGTDLRWTRIFYVIYFNMACFISRAFYRVFEFKDGNIYGKLSIEEKYFYTLDVMMMMFILLSWIIFHPSWFGFTSATSETNDVEMPEVKNNTQVNS